MSLITLPKRFSAFILTQSLGAFNDNLYKMLLQLYVLQIVVVKVMTDEMFIFLSTLIFAAPFVLFGPWSGYLADKFSKSRIMRIVKFAEIAIMLFGAMAFFIDSVWLMFIMLFLMASQSTFFSPAKYGYIPEICDPHAVSKANGWVEMSTFLSIILGTAVTGFLLSFHDNHANIAALYCIGVAILGSLTVLAIPKVPAAGTTKSFPKNPLTEMFGELKYLKQNKGLWLAALANSYFWLLGLIFQTNILIYGKNMLGNAPGSTVKLGLMPAFIGIGIAMGSLLASRWSGKKVELGLVPLGGFGMAFAGIILFFTQDSYLATSIILFFAGATGGLYIVPLYAYLQFYAKENEKGRVLAAAGILNGLFMVLGALIYGLFSVTIAIPPATIYLLMGIVTIGAVVYICTVIPEYFVRFCFWLLTNTFYRIRVIGDENIPLKGPALLTPNHVTFIDAFILGSTMQRFIRFIMAAEFFQISVAGWLFRLMDVIPIDPEKGRESVANSLREARKRLREGHVVCIFPEGKLTRDGEMNEFRPGFETIMKGMDCPIIPVYLHNLWGSMYSRADTKKIKHPHSLFRRVTVVFGEPLPASSKAAEVQNAVRALREKTV